MVGRRDPSEYEEIIALVTMDKETNKVRLHPVSGQGYSETMYIECSRKLRSLPIGTKVKILVVEKNPKDKLDSKHLYTSYKWDYELLE